MNRNEIYVMYGKSHKAMAKELAALVGLAGMIPDRNTKIGMGGGFYQGGGRLLRL